MRASWPEPAPVRESSRQGTGAGVTAPSCPSWSRALRFRLPLNHPTSTAARWPRTARRALAALCVVAVGIIQGSSVVVASAAVPVQVSAGSAHTCARLDNGSVKCWGNNDSGQLGDGSVANSSAPVLVNGSTTAVDVSAGARHTCAVLSDSTVQCWGDNGWGQLGISRDVPYRTDPVPVAGLANAVSVSSGSTYTCVLLSDATVSCWGGNLYGELGQGSISGANPVPRTVPGLAGALQVSTGRFHACARMQDSTAKCWGSNRVGQLGNGASGTAGLGPVPVSGLTGVTQISAGTGYSNFGSEDGWEHSCATLSSGAGVCWGSGDWGKLGDSSANIDRTTPVRVRNLDNVRQIRAGGSHSCAAEGDGTVSCWGYNAQLQVGSGATNIYYPLPQRVPNFGGVTSLTSGYSHNCTLHTDSAIKCWGANSLGQLGDGSMIDRITPVCVLGTGTAQQGCGPLPPPARMAAFGDSYSSGEGLLGDAPKYACGTDMHEAIYRADSTVAADRSWAAGDCDTRSLADVEPADLYSREFRKYENLCHRSPGAYPNQIKNRLRIKDSDYLFVACTGAVTRNVGLLSEPSGRAQHPASPANVHGGKTQIDTVDPDFTNAGQLDLVTIGIGGNDAGFGGIIDKCVRDSCLDPDFQARAVAKITGTTYARVRDTFIKLRGRFPSAKVLSFRVSRGDRRSQQAVREGRDPRVLERES